MGRSIAFIGGLIIFFVFNNVSADQDRTSLTTQLKNIRAKIVETEQELAPLKKEELTLRKDIRQLESQVKSLFEEQQKIKASLESILRSRETLKLQMITVREQISQKKTSFEDRVVHMFKTRRRLMPLSFLFASNGGAEDFYKRSSYLKYLIKSDRNRLKEFTSLLETLKLNKDEFSRLADEYEQQLEAGKNTSKAFEMKQMELAKAIKELDNKITKLGKRLLAYQNQEDEYERLLKELSQGSKVGVVGNIKPNSLSFPVEGQIIQHYGKQKHGEFKDIIFVKGVEVSAGEDLPVRVVKNGEVVFRSELPGFGKVLIVDHGSGIFSLYGRIFPLKNVGEQVKTDEIIAKTGNKDVDGRNFYFELRKDGKALNPERFFASR